VVVGYIVGSGVGKLVGKLVGSCEGLGVGASVVGRVVGDVGLPGQVPAHTGSGVLLQIISASKLHPEPLPHAEMSSLAVHMRAPLLIASELALAYVASERQTPPTSAK
jgi:hypothetical protein